MEQQVEKILVHDGVQLFNESTWTASNHSELKIFLLLGLREKEILSALQTTEKDIAKDIENLYLYYPWNTKIIGLYIQFNIERPAQIPTLLLQTLSVSLQNKLLPLQNFLLVIKDHRTLSGTGVSFKSIIENTMEFYLVNYNPRESDEQIIWDSKRSIKAEIESADLKRDSFLMNSFFCIQMKFQFEGFDEDLQLKQQQYLETLENPKNLVLVFQQLGQGGLIQTYQQMGEEFGKKLNIEAKKLIKINKEKQQSYTLVNMDVFDLASPQTQSMKCPSYSLAHTEKQNLRKIDINLLGIFSTSDNLNDQVDLFIKHCKRVLQNNFFQLSNSNNLMLLSYNLKESALLLQMMNTFQPSQFHDTAFKSQDYTEQRRQHIFKFCYEQMSPRLMAQNSVQIKGEIQYDRPLLIHQSLMKKNNFEGCESNKYVVDGDYMYYHYMQDGFNDNGWGCAYRSLQTLISYFKEEGFAPKIEIPTHRQIQEALVAMEDKEKDIIGSNQWIGAFEVSLCMQYFLNIECKIMNVASGLELQSKGRELRDHFLQEGSPIMIGGDLYAYTIIGVDFCEEQDDMRFLILDPHYPGSDNNIKNILQKGWCAWKDVTMFKADAFYNLCMPQRPQEI